ncbi:DUF4403 family protein [Pedobacter sp. BS3]|uniref:DUF4403 family protein n=1 Tax=Pedobacter sp. BS3 TaxID=2567937 RepID=UPI0011EDC132|nr:DUF4403 family protein [Pedobacter sp. BS3]TZF84575.1 DUF4403 family protein [Pedobacter sp. BS3]
MKPNYLTGACTAILLVVTACSTTNKIAALKPAPSYNTGPVVYQKQLSYINMPVEVAIADIQAQTNKYLNGLIYEDNSLDGDNLMLKVWKQAPAVVYEKNGRLEIELPLKIWTRVRYGIEKFGFSAYDTRDLNLNGRIKLNSLVSLDNWKVQTSTQIEDIQWTESPTVSVAGRNIPITYLINPALVLFKSQMAKMIDDAIAQSLDIKPYVTDALKLLSEPVEVDSTYHTWFGLQPVELYATKATIANKKVVVNLGLKAYMESTVGEKPTLAFDESKLQLAAVDRLPDDFNINLAGVITYENASALIQKNFAGQKFESGNRYVVVNNVALWGKDDKMIVELGMSGSVNGTFYLSGIPRYDAVKKEIYLDNVDFVLDSKNKLLKVGDWLVHGIITNKIQQNCRFSLAGQLNEAQKTLSGYLTNYQPVAGVKINGRLTQLSPDKVFLVPNAIIAMVAAKGKLSVSVDGLQ